MKNNPFETRVLIKKNIISNTFISILGIAFIMLSIFYARGQVIIDSQFVLGIALSGLFFVLSDFIFNRQEDSIEQKKEKHTQLIDKAYEIVRLVSMFLSILSLIAVPFVKFSLEPETIDKYATVVSIATIGFTILNIGFNNFKSQDKLNQHLYESIYEANRLFDKYKDSTDKQIDSLQKELAKHTSVKEDEQK